MWKNTSQFAFARRDFLKAAGFGAASLSLPGCFKTANSSTGKTPGGKPNIVLIMADDMVTCLDVARIDYPRTHGGNRIVPLEGKSLLPIFKSGRRKGHEAIFWEHEGNRAVR